MMIIISLLDIHPSSPKKIYKNLDELAKRADLYTGDNFYFGFESSNSTFLDIIGGQQPLAIKYGPILSLYQRSVDDIDCYTYYIDVANQTLCLVLEMQAKPTANLTLQSILPWLFVDAYLHATETLSGPSQEEAVEPSEEKKIQLILEQLAINRWPSEEAIALLSELTQSVLNREDSLKMTWGDLLAIKQKTQVKQANPSSNNIVATYNPFYDSVSVDIDFLLAQNPSHITIRQVNDSDPRIEILSPKLNEDERYEAIYKKSSPNLYQSFQEALNNPKQLTTLLKEHYKDLVERFLTTHSIAQSTPQQVASTLKKY